MALLAFAGNAGAITRTGGTGTDPWIASELPDYPPGGLVNLMGGSWQPGEIVHINVNDNQGQTWVRNADVTADANGDITDSFNLPDWFVAVYSVTATGSSGAVATTSFTDADQTTTSLTSSVNPSNLNQSVTFTATVKRTSLNTAVTVGNVRFGTGANCGGSFTQLQASQAPNSSGQVTYTTSALPAGSTTIRACYDGTGGGSGTQDSTGVLTQSVNAKQDQTIMFSAPTGKTYGNADFDAGATASSGLAVSYSSSTTSVCTIVSGNVHIVAAGDCTVTASQAGNASFNAAADVTRTFAIAKASQTLSFGAGSLPASKVYLGTFTPTASSTSGLTAAITVSGVCSRDASTGVVTMNSGTGSCTVKANQAGNDNYNAATELTQDVQASKASQTITINGVPASKVYLGTFTPTATSTSGLTVAVTVGGVCSRDSDTGLVTMTSGTGICTVSGSQAGNDNYESANTSAAVTATKAAQAITFASIADQVIGAADFAPGATADSGLTVAYSSSTAAVCTIAGGNIHLVAVGTCTVTASQAGNGNYVPATPVTHSFHVTFNFFGFSAPVDNPKWINKLKAGQSVPFKWRLLDANGVPVTNLIGATMAVGGLNCDTPGADGFDPIEEFAAGASGLQNLGDGYYQLNWKSLTSYANSCRTVGMNLGEGFNHTAWFQFTK